MNKRSEKSISYYTALQCWEKLRSLQRFDYYDIQTAHRILKREANIAFIVMRKNDYNVMRFRNALELDEAEVLAGRFSSVSARHYILNDPDKLSGKYVSAWKNFGVEISKAKI